MTVSVIYSRRAAAEAEEIIAFLSEYGERPAERFRALLRRAERQLADFPDSGASGARPGTRRLVVGDYILSYRRRGADVEIFAVRHARRRDSRL
ncbi:MAG: type II toxin-antitoxin system RelE/ParE family toxin [Alphaproteobacteria bacterium]